MPAPAFEMASRAALGAMVGIAKRLVLRHERTDGLGAGRYRVRQLEIRIAEPVLARLDFAGRYRSRGECKSHNS
jgi:hypothetical protein